MKHVTVILSNSLYTFGAGELCNSYSSTKSYSNTTFSGEGTTNTSEITTLSITTSETNTTYCKSTFSSSSETNSTYCEITSFSSFGENTSLSITTYSEGTTNFSTYCENTSLSITTNSETTSCSISTTYSNSQIMEG